MLTSFFQKTEPWEAEANKEEAESDDEDEEEIMQLKKKPKKPRPLKLINGELYRVNKFGKYFKLFINEKDQNGRLDRENFYPLGFLKVLATNAFVQMCDFV